MDGSFVRATVCIRVTPDLPNTKQVLHAHAYQRDANPTAQTHEDGLAARLDQFDNVGVEANRRHGHDNEELGKSLDGGGHGYRQGEHGGNDARQNEEKDEEREDLLDVERARGSTVTRTRLGGALCLSDLPKGEEQRNGDNRERARELDDCGMVERVGAGVHAVPRRRRGGYRGRVVHSSAGEQAKALVAHAKHAAKRGKDQRGDDIEQEDDADCLGDLLVVRIDDRSRGGDSGTAADRRAHAHERRYLARDVHDTAQDKGDHERGRDGGDNDGQRAGAHLGDLPQIESESEQDDRVLENLLRGVLDARGGGFRDTRALTQHVSHHHADENGEDGTTDDLESPPQQPGRHRDHQRQRHPAPQVLEILEELHASTFPNLNVATCSS